MIIHDAQTVSGKNWGEEGVTKMLELFRFVSGRKVASFFFLNLFFRFFPCFFFSVFSPFLCSCF